MKAYRIVNREDDRSLTEYLRENGQLLLPMVELIEASQMAIAELIDVLGRAQHRGHFGVVACPFLLPARVPDINSFPGTLVFSG